MRIGIVAGESSGDFLGAGLIRAVKERVPEARFEGVAGPLMQAAGCKAIYPAEALAVMGFTEVLSALPRLLGVRAELKRHFIANPPDAFIGIDAPAFNLGLEHALHAHAIPTAHYVSPSIWAWGPERIIRIGAAVDLMLALLPFEPPLYEKHGIKCVFTGHPLADFIPEHPDKRALREQLHLKQDCRIVALLPGSRRSEIRSLGRIFLDTAAWLYEQDSKLGFVIPAATPAINQLLKQMIRRFQPDLPVTLVEGHSHAVLGAADAGLIASGTATLEAMLYRLPMVVAYRLSGLSYLYVRAVKKLNIPYVSLPNLLAERELVPELLQSAARPEALGPAVMALLNDADLRGKQVAGLTQLRDVLRRGADGRAADAVLELIASRRRPAV